MLFLAMAAIPLIQSWCGLIPFSGNAWLVSIYLAVFSLMLLAGNHLAGRREPAVSFAAMLAAVFVLAATLSTWIALRQYFHLADSIWEINHNRGRPYANLAQPNNLATLLGMGLAGCLYFYEKRLLGRLAAGLLSVFLLMGIVVTQSRTPWVTSVAIIIFWMIKSRAFKPRLSLGWLLLWVALYGALVFSQPYLREALQFGGPSLADRAMALERFSLWSQMWHAVWDGPFWGYGWNQTAAAQVSVTVERPLSMLATYSHNLLLDLLLWNGLVPGTIIIMSTSVWLARIGWFAHSKESLFALIAAGFILTHSMFEYPFAYAYFLLPLGLLLGIASVDVPAKRQVVLPRVVLVALIVGGLWLLKTAINDYQIIKADYVAQRMEAAGVIGFESEVPITEVKLLTQFRELQRFKAMPPHGEHSEEELGWMKNVVHQYPHLANLYRYALILYLSGENEQAEYYLEVLCGLHGAKFCAQAHEEIEEYRKK